MTLTNKELWIDPAKPEKDRIRLSGHLLLGTIFVFAVAFIVWANWAELDLIVRGDARIVPSQQIQVVQTETLARIDQLPVREGDIVEKGQLLAVLNYFVEDEMPGLERRRHSALAAAARLEAEIAGKATSAEIVFPAEITEKAPDLIARERQQFDIRLAALKAQQETLTDEIAQRREEVNTLTTRIKSGEAQLATAARQRDMFFAAWKATALGEQEYLERKSRVEAIEGDIANSRAGREAAKAALAAAQSRLGEAEANYRAQAGLDYQRQQAEITIVEGEINRLKTKGGRQNLLAPVKGIVKEIKLRTIGGIVQPAQTIMEVVPIEDTLIVEGRVSPKDRGFLAVGQRAEVKITAYDFSIYGGLEAVVEQISADTVEDERKQVFFRVRLRTTKNYVLDHTGEKLQITPGMTASIDILTGKKTVMQYLLKPLIKTIDQALGER